MKYYLGKLILQPSLPPNTHATVPSPWRTSQLAKSVGALPDQLEDFVNILTTALCVVGTPRPHLLPRNDHLVLAIPAPDCYYNKPGLPYDSSPPTPPRTITRPANHDLPQTQPTNTDIDPRRADPDGLPHSHPERLRPAPGSVRD